MAELYSKLQIVMGKPFPLGFLLRAVLSGFDE